MYMNILNNKLLLYTRTKTLWHMLKEKNQLCGCNSTIYYIVDSFPITPSFFFFYSVLNIIMFRYLFHVLHSVSFLEIDKYDFTEIHVNEIFVSGAR